MYQRTCHVYGQTSHYKVKEEGRNKRREGRGRRGAQRTCHVYGQTRQYKGAKRRKKREAKRGRKDSTSVPVTSMDRHTRFEGRGKEGEMTGSHTIEPRR